MCKNTNTPCPGCKKHERTEAAWVFFTDEERLALAKSNKAPDLVDLNS